MVSLPQFVLGLVFIFSRINVRVVSLPQFVLGIVLIVPLINFRVSVPQFDRFSFDILLHQL